MFDVLGAETATQLQVLRDDYQASLHSAITPRTQLGISLRTVVRQCCLSSAPLPLFYTTSAYVYYIEC